jgi:hypothetical protein
MPARKSFRKRRPAPRVTGTLPLLIGTEQVECVLRRSARKTLGMQVFADGAVQVTAPLLMPVDDIARLLHEKSGWIAEQRRKLADRAAARPPMPKAAFRHGEPVVLLGAPHTIVVEPAPGRKRMHVRLHPTEPLIIVSAGENASEVAVSEAVEAWLAGQARRVLNEAFTRRLPLCDALGMRRPARLTLRSMRSRWGSCSGSRSIRLNTRMIHLPPHLIDYVVVHELCHLKEMNHSPRFWALVSRALPEYEALRRELRTVPVTLWQGDIDPFLAK